MPFLPACSFYAQSLLLSSAVFPSFLHSGQSSFSIWYSATCQWKDTHSFLCHLPDTIHHSTIKVNLSAICSLHTEEGLDDALVGCLKLQCTLWGIKRHQGSHQQKRQPITSDLLQRFRCSLEPSNYDHTMVQAACCLGFFGFLGAGKFTFNPDIHLTIDNIQADSLLNPPNFRIFIKCSKTDTFLQGCYVYIDTGSLDLCPVRALIQNLHLHGSTPGPLFLLSDSTPFNCQWLSFTIQSILSSARVPGCFTGCSFCIGAPTLAASQGLPNHLIKSPGRWSSDTYQLYIGTHISTFVGVASQPVWQVFSSCLIGCLNDLGRFRAMASPSHEPFVSLTWTYG